MKFSPPALEHRTHLPTPNTVLSMFPVSGVQKPSAIVHQSCSAKTRTHNFQINLIDQNPISKVGGARLGTEGGPWSAEALLPLCGVVEPCSTRTGRCRIPMRGAGTATIRISHAPTTRSKLRLPQKAEARLPHSDRTKILLNQAQFDPYQLLKVRSWS